MSSFFKGIERTLRKGIVKPVKKVVKGVVRNPIVKKIAPIVAATVAAPFGPAAMIAAGTAAGAATHADKNSAYFKKGLKQGAFQGAGTVAFAPVIGNAMGVEASGIYTPGSWKAFVQSHSGMTNPSLLNQLGFSSAPSIGGGIGLFGNAPQFEKGRGLLDSLIGGGGAAGSTSLLASLGSSLLGSRKAGNSEALPSMGEEAEHGMQRMGSSLPSMDSSVHDPEGKIARALRRKGKLTDISEINLAIHAPHFPARAKGKEEEETKKSARGGIIKFGKGGPLNEQAASQKYTQLRDLHRKYRANPPTDEQRILREIAEARNIPGGLGPLARKYPQYLTQMNPYGEGHHPDVVQAQRYWQERENLSNQIKGLLADTRLDEGAARGLPEFARAINNIRERGIDRGLEEFLNSEMSTTPFQPNEAHARARQLHGLRQQYHDLGELSEEGQMLHQVNEAVGSGNIQQQQAELRRLAASNPTMQRHVARYAFSDPRHPEELSDFAAVAEHARSRREIEHQIGDVLENTNLSPEAAEQYPTFAPLVRQHGALPAMGSSSSAPRLSQFSPLPSFLAYSGRETQPELTTSTGESSRAELPRPIEAVPSPELPSIGERVSRFIAEGLPPIQQIGTTLLTDAQNALLRKVGISEEMVDDARRAIENPNPQDEEMNFLNGQRAAYREFGDMHTTGLPPVGVAPMKLTIPHVRFGRGVQHAHTRPLEDDYEEGVGGFAEGGSVDSHYDRQFVAGGYIKTGDTDGAADDVKVYIPKGSYVWNAMDLALLGNGYSDNGAKKIAEAETKILSHTPHEMHEQEYEWIPALVSNGEYVSFPEVVTGLGSGSNSKGARAIHTIRKNLRKQKGVKDILPPLTKPLHAYATGGHR